jgi:1-deoxy-D-xylulose 5-phosphate reductoisomerase
MLRTVTLLGATGSVGRSTRDVIAENPDRLAIGGVVGGGMRRRWRGRDRNRCPSPLWPIRGGGAR